MLMIKLLSLTTKTTAQSYNNFSNWQNYSMILDEIVAVFVMLASSNQLPL